MSEEPIGIGISGIDLPDYLRPQYANLIEVGHTPWDFRLIFGLLRTPARGQRGLENPEQSEGGQVMIAADGVADIIIPANVMYSLIAALRTNFDAYIQQYGAPGLNPEGPGQHEG